MESALKGSDRGGTVDIYGGYRMQNAQFGLSYANIRCDGCKSSYILASGAYVFENLHNTIKPFLGFGIGIFNYEVSEMNFDESGLFGTVNLGINVEFGNLFFGTEFRQRIFGGAEKDEDLYGYNLNSKIEPKNTFLLFVGYKF
ncbi:MAG: hypothetical protein LBI78_03655 [Campylobacteraceae bacterium]|nr:hypothetical protein [Campylobacteraceae bacterium]